MYVVIGSKVIAKNCWTFRENIIFKWPDQIYIDPIDTFLQTRKGMIIKDRRWREVWLGETPFEEKNVS